VISPSGVEAIDGADHTWIVAVTWYWSSALKGVGWGVGTGPHFCGSFAQVCSSAVCAIDDVGGELSVVVVVVVGAVVVVVMTGTETGTGAMATVGVDRPAPNATMTATLTTTEANRGTPNAHQYLPAGSPRCFAM
jgi:hypothetical protein